MTRSYGKYWRAQAEIVLIARPEVQTGKRNENLAEIPSVYKYRLGETTSLLSNIHPSIIF